MRRGGKFIAQRSAGVLPAGYGKCRPLGDAMRMRTADSKDMIRPPERVEAADRSSWPRWLVCLVVLGSLLTATGALLAIHPSGEHLNAAGQNYADYFLTRNLAMAAMLLLMLALRARRVLAGLMILTALVQTLDAITASVTGRLGLLPVDLIFAAAFVIGAGHLAARPLWRRSAWRQPDV